MRAVNLSGASARYEFRNESSSSLTLCAGRQGRNLISLFNCESIPIVIYMRPKHKTHKEEDDHDKVVENTALSISGDSCADGVFDRATGCKAKLTI